MKQTANKAVPFLLLLLVLAYVVKQPAEAGHTFSGLKADDRYVNLLAGDRGRSAHGPRHGGAG